MNKIIIFLFILAVSCFGQYGNNLIGESNFDTDCAPWIMDDTDSIWTATFDGRVGVMLDTITVGNTTAGPGISFASQSASVNFTIWYRYYTPSGNTTVAGVKPRLTGGIAQYITLRTGTVGSWVAIEEDFTTDSTPNRITFFVTNNSGNVTGTTVGDSLLLDSVYIRQKLDTLFIDPTNGDDDSLGTITAPMKTYAGALARGTYPGGVFAQRTGTITRETLTVPASGSAGLPITFTKYDSTGESGADPIISGIKNLVDSTWTTKLPDTLSMTADMEEGDLTDFHITNAGVGGAIDTSTAQSRGTYSARLRTSASTAYTYGEQTIDANDTIYYIDTWVYFDTDTSTFTTNETGKILDILTTGFAAVGNVKFRYNGSVWQLTADGGTQWFTMETDTWTRISLNVVENAWTFYIDGISKDTGTYINDAGKVRFGMRDFSGGTPDLLVYIDDCAFYDTTMTNIWSTSFPHSGYFPRGPIIFDDTLGIYTEGGPDSTAVEDPYMWTYDYGTQKVYIHCRDNPSDEYSEIEIATFPSVIEINDKSNIVIDGLHIKGANGYYDGEHGGIYIVKSDTITIQNCEVEHCNSGIAISNTTDSTGNSIIVQLNTLHDNQEAGIRSTSHDGNSLGLESYIKNNTIYNNTRFGVWVWGDYFIVENNTIYNNGRALSGEYDYSWNLCIGIMIYGYGSGDTTSNNIIRYNKIYGTQSNSTDGGGILFDVNSKNNTGYCNLCYLNDGPGIYAWTSDSIFIYNNTCFGNGLNSSGELPANEAAEFLLQGPGANNIFLKNNIGYSDTGLGIYVGPNVYDQTLDITNNIWYSGGSNFYFWNDGTGNNLATWNALTGIGTDINSDPLFTDAANADFTLTASSPAIDAGTDVGLTSDFNGATVPFNAISSKSPDFDIGAYEYQFLIQTGYDNKYMRCKDYYRIKGY